MTEISTAGTQVVADLLSERGSKFEVPLPTSTWYVQEETAGNIQQCSGEGGMMDTHMGVIKMCMQPVGWGCVSKGGSG